MGIPNEFAIHVYDSIMEEGQKFGLKHCGYYAQRAVRIEKFYAYWGQDLDSYTTPMECGRAFRCKMKADIPFIGREALQEQVAKKPYMHSNNIIIGTCANFTGACGAWCKEAFCDAP